MSFERPVLLLLALLVPALWKLVRVPGRRLLTTLRCTIAALAVLAAAGPRLDMAGPGIDLIVIADRSLSVGREGLESESEILRLVGGARTRGEHDRIAVVAFGARALVETRPGTGPVSPRFDRDVGDGGSALAEALRLAARMRSPGRRTRVLVLSDGLYTGEDPMRTDVLADLGDVPVWTRRVGRPAALDVAAGPIVLPVEAPEKAGFLVRYSVSSPGVTEVGYTLRSGGTVLASGTKTLGPGTSHFFARDIAEKAGVMEYTLEITSPADPVPENNVAGGLLRVKSAPGALVASGTTAPGLIAASLGAASIPVDVVDASAMDFSAARLVPYRLVVLENVSLEHIGPERAASLAQAVESGVTSLLVTGGEASFGQGGYHMSALDPLLPVTMELRDDQIRGAMALVAVLDRSGSMAVTVAGGRTKMDLANIGVAEAIRLLSPRDQVSVIAVDSSPHVIVPLCKADDTARLVKAVLGIESMGGGIFVRTGLGAASAEIRKSGLPTRHILLFSDAADSEEQGDSVDLVRGLHKQGVGLSVIGLGLPADVDAAFLRSLAKAGGGKVTFTDRAGDLPRIFSGEVIRVAERGFVKEKTAVRFLPDMVRLQLSPDLPPFHLGGYNLSSLRKGASAAVMTGGKERTPIVAFWRKGRASVGTITAEVDGPYAGDFPSWEKSQALIVNLARLLASSVSQADVEAFSTLDGSTAEVRLEVDEGSAALMRSRPLSVRFLSPAGADPIDVPLAWQTAATASARVDLSQPGHYLPVVDLGQDGVVEAPPITLSYSPEYRPADVAGEDVLAGLSRATGGRPLVKADDAFSGDGASSASAWLDVSPWLALAILLLLLAEIAGDRLRLGFSHDHGQLSS